MICQPKRQRCHTTTAIDVPILEPGGSTPVDPPPPPINQDRRSELVASTAGSIERKKVTSSCIENFPLQIKTSTSICTAKFSIFRAAPSVVASRKFEFQNHVSTASCRAPVSIHALVRVSETNLFCICRTFEKTVRLRHPKRGMPLAQPVLWTSFGWQYLFKRVPQSNDDRRINDSHFSNIADGVRLH